MLKPEDQQIIANNIPLVKDVVNKMCQQNICKRHLFDDYVSVGIETMIKCLPKYNPEKAAFSTYARAAIRNRILNFIRDKKSLHRHKEIDLKNAKAQGKLFEKSSEKSWNQSFVFEVLDCLSKTEQEYFKLLYLSKNDKADILKSKSIKTTKLDKIIRSIKDKIYNNYVANQ